MRYLTLALIALLALVQAELWAGKGGRSHVVQLQSQWQAQQQANEAARQRNERLAAEVNDLKEGLEMVEEKARSELGMIGSRESFYQVVPQPGSAVDGEARTRTAQR